MTEKQIWDDVNLILNGPSKTKGPGAYSGPTVPAGVPSDEGGNRKDNRRCKRCGAYKAYDAYYDKWVCRRCDQ